MFCQWMLDWLHHNVEWQTAGSASFLSGPLPLSWYCFHLLLHLQWKGWSLSQCFIQGLWGGGGGGRGESPPPLPLKFSLDGEGIANP